MLLHYLVKFENPKKMLRNFHVERVLRNITAVCWWGCCQNQWIILNFRLSQSSIATYWYCRWGGKLREVYIENLPTNQ